MLIRYDFMDRHLTLASEIRIRKAKISIRNYEGQQRFYTNESYERNQNKDLQDLEITTIGDNFQCFNDIEIGNPLDDASR